MQKLISSAKRLSAVVSRFEAWIVPIWEHWLSGGVIWAVPVVFLIWYPFSTPSPGMASVVCGAFVALMVLRNMTASHKFLCTFLVLALVATEIRSIRIDRQKQDFDHLEAERRLQQKFNDTQFRIEGVFNQARLATDNVTGGDSYPCILPIHDLRGGIIRELLNLGDKGRKIGDYESYFLLRLENVGKYPLNGIRVDSTMSGFNEMPIVVFQPFATLAPNGYMDYAWVHFNQSKNDSANYLFFLEAQNGAYTERLEVQVPHGKIFFPRLVKYRYDIYKGTGSNDADKLKSIDWQSLK
jgi:hypothetical protein